jgi:heterodisulfide reductase subunit A
LVVLVNSLVPSSGIRQLAQTLGIALDARGFVQTDPYSPTETSVEGIFACGYCESPMDIPSSVAQAGGASARALEVVTRVRSEKLL